jgi:CARDB
VTVNDPLLLSLSTPAIAQQNDQTKGDSLSVIESLTIPVNQAAGQYYLWIILDSTSSAGQGQVNESNDKVFLPLYVTNPQGPDLVVRNFTLSRPKVPPGGTTTANFSIANQGSRATSPSITQVFLSASNQGVVLLRSINTPAIAPGQQISESFSVTVPVNQQIGDHYLWVVLDVNNSSGQPPAARANDKAFVPLILATDTASLPLRFAKAMANTCKALSLPRTFPDFLAEIKSQVDNLRTIGEDVTLIKDVNDLRSITGWIATQPDFASLAPLMDEINQNFGRYVARKAEIQIGAEIAKFLLDNCVDSLVEDYLQNKISAPVAHSFADSVYHFILASIYFSTGDLPSAYWELFDQAWDQTIRIWNETVGLNDDVNAYIVSLINLGKKDLDLYQTVRGLDPGKPADAVRAEKLTKLIAAGDAASWENVNALWNQLSPTISSTKRPLVAWRIIQGLVRAREAEIAGHPTAASLFVSEVRSYVSWPSFVVVPLFGFNLKAFANELASSRYYNVQSWVPLPP